MPLAEAAGTECQYTAPTQTDVSGTRQAALQYIKVFQLVLLDSAVLLELYRVGPALNHGSDTFAKIIATHKE
jgi:hypothetical protein